jgi:murein DD-endopeptidase MepM/ murein hydrolase activator NlpD
MQPGPRAIPRAGGLTTALPAVTDTRQPRHDQSVRKVMASPFGHSGGPHLHYEVYVNGDANSDGAVDPETWMRDHAVGQAGQL